MVMDSVRDLKTELNRLGINYAGCVEKQELIERLGAHGVLATFQPATGAGHSTPAPLNRGVLLAALRGTLALQGTEVTFLDMREGRAAVPLALEDAVRIPEVKEKPTQNHLLALEDAPRQRLLALTDGEVRAYEESRIAAYQAAASEGAACTVLALPAACRVGSDACTPLLAYRHGSVLALPSGPHLEALRAAYGRHRLFEKLELDMNIFDETWDLDFTVPPFDSGFGDALEMRGGRSYRRPLGWRRFGLYVCNKFPDADWLAQDGRQGEWAVAYHGTAAYAVRPIASAGLRAGGSGGVERHHGAMFGDGIYCAPHVEHAAFFAEPVPVETESGIRHYQVVFQCRVQPGSLQVHNDGLGDVFVVPSEADIRPYAVLLGECSADGTPTLTCREDWIP